MSSVPLFVSLLLSLLLLPPLSLRLLLLCLRP